MGWWGSMPTTVDEMTAGVCELPLLASDGCDDGQQMMVMEPVGS